MTHQRRMIIIAGPTGVGKSDFGVQIAEQIPAEIINADMGQLYKPLSIGTAKPDWRNEKVPHHLFDEITEPENFTAARYRERLYATVDEVIARGKIPIIIGGSSFYISSLFFPPDDAPHNEYHADGEQTNLWTKLHDIDPERATAIHPHDQYRLQRALAIWQTTGTKPSEHKPTFADPGMFWFFFITRNREQLYERINARVEDMIQQGWVEEVDALRDEWRYFLKKKKIIGYDLIIDYLASHDVAKDELIALISKKTRHYAKRQIIFWRMFRKKLLNNLLYYSERAVQSKIVTLNLTYLDREIYRKKLLSELELITRE